ncbi:MobA/MobL family protein [Alicycliphilus denitrificans]|jgi:hypothetical protein|uniref:MobA/MobL family protein n=1 Tax=Alicycliphilus denitrificans TaxID=179636 RepID=UPI0019167E2C|nr:MobA/MobL family protein [Alicycliphilus denitrificans]
MAIFHLSARAPITRASGRSATAAAAYRAGALICDERTGLVFDYRHRHGVLDARIQLPGGRLVADREGFWNGVEVHHRRRDAVLAREVVLALPDELDADERAELAFGFAREIANEFGVGVDCALHAPSRDGDDRNHHAHLLMTACAVDAEGMFGKKVERLDPIACRRSGTPDSVSWLRPRWQDAVNDALAQKGSAERIDHRSFKARGIELLPTVHVGMKGAGARRRAGLNGRLQAQNAKALVLEAKMSKLLRIKARLAARLEPRPNPRRTARVIEDLESDLLLWRRQKASQVEQSRSLPKARAKRHRL